MYFLLLKKLNKPALVETKNTQMTVLANKDITKKMKTTKNQIALVPSKKIFFLKKPLDLVYKDKKIMLQ